MDWEDYPAEPPTALREAKARLRGARPARGRCSAPDPWLFQELAAWAAATRLTRGVILDAALAAVPAGKGRRAGHPVRPRDVLARAVRAVLSAIRLGHAPYKA